MRNPLQCLDVLTVRSAEVTFDGVLLEAELAPLLRLGGGCFRRGRGRLVLRGSDPRHQEHDQHPNPEHASQPPRVSRWFQSTSNGGGHTKPRPPCLHRARTTHPYSLSGPCFPVSGGVPFAGVLLDAWSSASLRRCCCSCCACSSVLACCSCTRACDLAATSASASRRSARTGASFGSADSPPERATYCL